MSNWKWYKKSYNKSGKLVQEIQYPFPHNPLNGTTKIIENQYIGDTLISKVLNGKNDLVSETICINGSGIQDCKTINYGSLNNSSYKKLEKKYMVITKNDTIINLSKVIQLTEIGNQVDTLKNYEKPIFREQNKDSIENYKSIEYVKFDTINYSNLILYGFLKVRQNDTLSITYIQEIDINRETKFVERLTINYEQTRTDKSDTFWQKGKVFSSKPSTPPPTA